ncbi:MAG TPA: hypothetical protein VFS42_00480 [Burkholderiaceae bacterium]|nr:hypothetical protein [Burkholderiaceae bacterium]
MKFVLLLVLAAIVLLVLKKAAAPSRSVPSSTTPAIRRALNEGQQALFARLQSALPSTMILVQPALAHVLDARGDDGGLLADFAVCRKDSSPLAIVLLDEPPGAERIARLAQAAGLRVARFRSGKLPNDQDIKDALGFL